MAKRYSQPQTPIVVNGRVLWAFLPNNATGSYIPPSGVLIRNLATASPSPTSVFGVGKMGSMKGIKPASSGGPNASVQIPVTELNSAFSASGAGSVLIVCKSESAAGHGSGVPAIMKLQSGGSSFNHYPYTDGNIYVGPLSATRYLNGSVSGATAGIYEPHVAIATAKSGAQRFYINGVLRGSGSAAETPSIDTSGAAGFGEFGNVYLAVFFDRVLSDGEIKSLSDNPWSLFRAANSPIFVPVSGGGGSPYTLTADAGAVAITGSAANLAFNRTFTADAGALAISGNAATLAFNRALIADTENVAITGNAASLVFTPVGGPTYTLPADSAAVAISGAATSLVRGYNLTASAGAVSISASDAALMATRKLIADAYAAVIAGADATLTYTPAVLPTIGRPASDTSNSGWTASTGTDLFAMVDEVTPDALDYIVTTATGSVCELALDTTAYPGTASQALKYRASSSTGNSLIVRLKNGATTIRTETQALTASDTEYTITLTSGEIAAITSGSLSVELESA